MHREIFFATSQKLTWQHNCPVLAQLMEFECINKEHTYSSAPQSAALHSVYMENKISEREQT